jgi:hypothetical protein
VYDPHAGEMQATVEVVVRVGRPALPGALVLLVAGVLFSGGWHVYWLTSSVTMLILAVGLGLATVALPVPSRVGDWAG